MTRAAFRFGGVIPLGGSRMAAVRARSLARPLPPLALVSIGLPERLWVSRPPLSRHRQPLAPTVLDQFVELDAEDDRAVGQIPERRICLGPALQAAKRRQRDPRSFGQLHLAHAALGSQPGESGRLLRSRLAAARHSRTLPLPFRLLDGSSRLGQCSGMTPEPQVGLEVCMGRILETFCSLRSHVP